MIRRHKVTKTALGISFLVALCLISDNHKRCILISFDVSPSINSCFSDYPWEIFTNMNIVVGLHFKDEPVEYFLTIYQGLVDPYLHNGFSLKVPCVADSHIVPVGACFIEHIVYIFNSVV
jgi:hypothetical protein